MPRATVNRWRDLDIELEYETFGDPADPTILLVTGYTGQLLMSDFADDAFGLLTALGIEAAPRLVDTIAVHTDQ